MPSAATTPDFLYRINIEGLPLELEALRSGEIYWLNMTEWDDCLLVARRILTGADAKSRGAFIGTTDTSWTQEKLQTAASAHDLRAFMFIEGSMAALLALPTDLDRAMRPQQRTIMVLLPNAPTEQASHAQIREMLSIWKKWLSKNECAFLVLHHDARAQSLTNSLISDNDLLSGLILFQREDARRISYSCAYWRNALGVVASRKLTLEQTDGHLSAIKSADTASSELPGDTPRRYIIESGALAGFAQIQDKNWEIVDSAETVYELARTETDATVVFALRRHAQLPVLAQTLHSLRLERGPVLRLVVRELSTQLRLQDEQKLLDCGANLIIGANLGYTRFRSMLENIQTVRYNRKLVEAPESLFATTIDDGANGVVSPSEFVKHIKIILSAPEASQTPSVLVQMRPVPGLTTAQVLKQLNLRRFEDIACVQGRDMYLFLHGCMPSLVTDVLTQLFRLPFDELFSAHTVYADEQSIRAALAQAQTQINNPQNVESLTESDDLEIHFDGLGAPAAGLTPARYSPKRITFALV